MFYDPDYQRVRQIKRAGPIGTGAFADDILYVVPGGFEISRDAQGRVIKSTATISGPDGSVATVTTNFDVSTGLPVVGAGLTAQTAPVSGFNTVTKLLLKDHLGSMVAEVTITGSVNAAGQVTAGTVSIVANTFNVHGFGPWGNARNAASPLNGDSRGFTGHEHLAELGLIHMNGRIYDPVIGRFLQADPIIQAPHNAQSHNRYSYVMNNPLSFTDPSGFSRWTRFRDRILKPVLAIVVAIVTYGAVNQFLLGQIASFALQGGTSALTLAGGSAGIGISTTGFVASGAVAGAAAGFAAGGIMGGNIQSALQGAFSGFLTGGVGGFFGEAFSIAKGVSQTAASAAATRINGGDWRAALRVGAVMTTLGYVGRVMRTEMVEQSRSNPDNISGESYGVDGDRFKIAGARQQVNPFSDLGDYVKCDSLMGGCQGAPVGPNDVRSSFFGNSYSVGSVQDKINEAFAGPHDWFRNATGAYDAFGNGNNTFRGIQLWVQDYPMNYGLVLPAAPFALGIIAPPAVYGPVSAVKKRN